MTFYVQFFLTVIELLWHNDCNHKNQGRRERLISFHVMEKWEALKWDIDLCQTLWGEASNGVN